MRQKLCSILFAAVGASIPLPARAASLTGAEPLFIMSPGSGSYGERTRRWYTVLRTIIIGFNPVAGSTHSVLQIVLAP